MSDTLKIARDTLLEPSSITDSQLQRVLGSMLGHTIDTADLYFASSIQESWCVEDSIVKSASHDVARGVGVRAISGEKTGLAYSDEIVLPALTEAANAASNIAKLGGDGNIQAWQQTQLGVLYPVDNPLASLDEKGKIAFIESLDKEARAQDSRVSQVIISLAGEYETILVASSDGTLAADIRPLVRLNVSVIVEEKGRRETGSMGGGGRTDYQYFIRDDLGKHYAREAVRRAIVNLQAIEAPAGAMPVVLGNGWPGILLHEAVGHGLEGDFNRKGTSTFSGRIGERVASRGVTVVDNGCMPGRRGSLSVDDEGTPTEETVLIEDGILKGYMNDKLNAKLMGMKSTGNGRRESYAHMPMPRMTNTYMLAGKYDPQEIISSVEKGIYAVNFGGGQVDITSGKFVFSTSEAYLIENGKVTVPIKGATLIGDGPSVMTRIAMVGNDLALDTGVGVCGKEGQSVPVGVGQPTLKIDKITVGGTK